MKYSFYKDLELLEKERKKLKVGTADPAGMMRASGGGRQGALCYGGGGEGMGAGKNVSRKGLDSVVWDFESSFSPFVSVVLLAEWVYSGMPRFTCACVSEAVAAGRLQEIQWDICVSWSESQGQGEGGTLSEPSKAWSFVHQ